MITRTLLLSGSTVALALGLTACDGTGPNPPAEDTRTIELRAAVSGALQGATCTAAPINNPSNVLDSAETEEDGFAQVTVPGNTGPVLVNCSGGQYVSTNAGASQTGASVKNTESLPQNQNIRAAVPANRTNVAVTLLTDLIVERLNALGDFTITDAQILDLAQQLSSFFGVGDILDPSQPVTSLDDLANLQGNQAGVYAAVLAALANIAQQTGNDPIALLNILRNDIQDGLIQAITQSQVDDATNDVAQGTPAADVAAQNQQQDDRNTGNIDTPTGGAGG